MNFICEYEWKLFLAQIEAPALESFTCSNITLWDRKPLRFGRFPTFPELHSIRLSCTGLEISVARHPEAGRFFRHMPNVTHLDLTGSSPTWFI